MIRVTLANWSEDDAKRLARAAARASAGHAYIKPAGSVGLKRDKHDQFVVELNDRAVLWSLFDLANFYDRPPIQEDGVRDQPEEEMPEDFLKK